MENPWSELSTEPPFLTPQDLAFLVHHIQTGGIDASPFHFEALPAPFCGNLDSAAIVLLLLNPGWGGIDEGAQENAAYRQAERDCLLFKTDPPLYFLAPRFAGTQAHQWLQPRLREFIHRSGIDFVARTFMQVQYFPYHSQEMRKLPPIFPSQRYSFWLVEEAMRRGKEIVMMRSERVWLNAVPSLRNYPYMTVSNVRNPHLNQTQLGAANFNRLLDLLTAQRT